MDNSSNIFNAKTLQEQLICPVLLEPLTKAVSIIPCAHKVQQAAAESMFGAIHGGWKVQSQNLCPICRKPVLGYTTDHSIRNIVKQLFELKEGKINAMLASVKNDLSEKSILVKNDVVRVMPYPGNPAKFIHTNGSWKFYESNSPMCRYLKFETCNEDSLITKFEVIGYRDGDVCICLSFSKKKSYEDLKQYFKQFDLFPSNLDLDYNYLSVKKDMLKVFFNILSENNEIPDSHFTMIRDLVAKGTHEL